MALDDDVHCVRALVEGDQRALAALYDRYSALMLAVGQKILGQRKEAEDLLHDVFLEAWRAAKDYDPERGSVRAWLVLRMRSRALDRIRAAGRAKVVLHADGEAEEPTSERGTTAMEFAADRDRIRRAVAALPDDQRPVLERIYFRGMTGPEVAEELGLPLGTVKSRLARALKHLRAEIRSTAEAFHEAG